MPRLQDPFGRWAQAAGMCACGHTVPSVSLGSGPSVKATGDTLVGHLAGGLCRVQVGKEWLLPWRYQRLLA